MARQDSRASTPKSDLDILPNDILQWAKSQQWTALRPIQKKVWSWFQHDTSARDLIVCAPTATGKTEAVFLPQIAGLGLPDDDGFDVLYICPLKALIDQQSARLKSLMGLRKRGVTRWHGDTRSGRVAAERKPEGLLVITPESMERVIRQDYAKRMFKNLRAIVIDELHAFFDAPRGVQIVSQMARLELLIGRKVSRIGLSATMSDEAEDAARNFLRPGNPKRVAVVSDDTAITPIEYRLDAFVQGVPDQNDRAEGASNSKEKILKYLEDTLCKPLYSPSTGRSPPPTKTLVFCNSRQLVEFFATRLRSVTLGSRQQRRINWDSIVFPHHGSLDADKRKAAEHALREQGKPAIVISTTTLELGLDVGDIEHVVQIDAGPTVSSLRQRLGRSGRRAGKLAKLTMLLRESPAGSDTHPLAQLHLGLVQALAQLSLVQRKLFETSEGQALHLSTFLQQVLSMAQTGVRRADLQSALFDEGPFIGGARESYDLLLRRLARPAASPLSPIQLLTLSGTEDSLDAKFGLTMDGQKVVGDKGFGAAFSGGRLYLLKAGKETLGTLPAGHGLNAGDPIYFSARRWAVVKVIENPATILLRPAASGRPPRFTGSPIAPSHLVVSTMRDLLSGSCKAPKADLGDGAAALWKEARGAFRTLGLLKSQLLEFDGGIVLFPWCGFRVQVTLLAALRFLGLAPAPAHVAIVIADCGLARVQSALASIAEGKGIPPADELARMASSTRLDKHDSRLGPTLERRNYASARLDMAGARRAASSMLRN